MNQSTVKLPVPELCPDYVPYSSIRKGIIMAGGSGTRLHPVTKVVNKHLLPIYDKPMIYYPLTTLISGGVKDIMIITNSKDLPLFKELLSDGSEWGVKITYAEQAKPEGIAQAFLIAKDFIKDSPCVLILGDNIFAGAGLQKHLVCADSNTSGTTVFAIPVDDPERFGVINLDKNGFPLSIEEKPTNPKSNLAVVGLYYYDNLVAQYAKKIIPSARGELEITALNNQYLASSNLKLSILEGFDWLDTGTPESLLKSSKKLFQLNQDNVRRASN